MSSNNAIVPFILFCLCFIFTIIFLIVRVLKGGVCGLICKIIASFMFMITSIVALTLYNPNLGCMFIVLGLLCGFVGDIVLDLKVIYKEHNDIYLNTGMFAFGLGHIFYFVGLINLVLNSVEYKAMSKPIYIPILIGLGVAIILSIVILISTKLMKLNFGKFFYQSGAYTLLLTGLSAISIVFAVMYQITILWVFGIGAILILISDLILSLNYFGGKEDDKFLIVLNHLIYYIGQIVIAGFIFFV